MAPAPGVWRPTPPANAPFLAPWLSRLRPWTLTADGGITNWAAYNAQPRAWGAARNPDGTLTSDPTGTGWIERFRAPAPPALGSATYAAEFDEVKALGAKASPARTPAQTETALFISGIAVAPLQAALRDLAARRGLDISDRARLFAAVTMSVADAGIVCWDCKYHYGLWRPITAIRLAAEDGNPATEADPAWEPLIATPPYPDYSSGANSLVGSATRALTRVLDSNRIDLYLSSPATNTTRHYESADALCQDTVDARVWSGLHFRTADVVALAAGTPGGRLGARPLPPAAADVARRPLLFVPATAVGCRVTRGAARARTAQGGAKPSSGDAEGGRRPRRDARRRGPVAATDEVDLLGQEAPEAGLQRARVRHALGTADEVPVADAGVQPRRAAPCVRRRVRRVGLPVEHVAGEQHGRAAGCPPRQHGLAADPAAVDLDRAEAAGERGPVLEEVVGAAVELPAALRQPGRRPPHGGPPLRAQAVGVPLVEVAGQHRGRRRPATARPTVSAPGGAPPARPNRGHSCARSRSSRT